MSGTRDEDQGPAPPRAEAVRPGAEESHSGLPRDVQEHLGYQLRAEYDIVADKPAFLGDPAVPVEFEMQLARIDRRQRVHHSGIEAVAAALQDLSLERGIADELGAERRSPAPDGKPTDEGA